MEPKISVILPVYNNEKTIAAAMRSIFNQSYTDFELIVINDGSSDRTAEILNSFQDQRLRVIGDGKNMGLPRRLNQGIDLARGQYIARMDADDISFPERLEKQVSYLESHGNIDLLATRAVTFNDRKELMGMLPYAGAHEDIVSRPWNSIPMPHPTWIARREWISRYKYALPEIWYAEDQDLLLRAHQESRYACLPDILLCYYQGKFRYKKTCIARRNLFRAQRAYFLSHQQYGSVMLSCCVFGIKSIMDIVQLLPFGQRKIRAARWSNSIPENIRARVQKLLESS